MAEAKDSSPPSTTSAHLMCLPAELRNQIYGLVLDPPLESPRAPNVGITGNQGRHGTTIIQQCVAYYPRTLRILVTSRGCFLDKYLPALARVCRTIHKEVLPRCLAKNVAAMTGGCFLNLTFEVLDFDFSCAMGIIRCLPPAAVRLAFALDQVKVRLRVNDFAAVSSCEPLCEWLAFITKELQHINDVICSGLEWDDTEPDFIGLAAFGKRVVEYEGGRYARHWAAVVREYLKILPTFPFEASIRDEAEAASQETGVKLAPKRTLGEEAYLERDKTLQIVREYVAAHRAKRSLTARRHEW
jgi:hypothetical protein